MKLLNGIFGRGDKKNKGNPPQENQGEDYIQLNDVESEHEVEKKEGNEASQDGANEEQGAPEIQEEKKEDLEANLEEPSKEKEKKETQKKKWWSFSKDEKEKPPKKEKKEKKGGFFSRNQKPPKPPKEKKERANSKGSAPNFGNDLAKLRQSVQLSSLKSLEKIKNAGGAVHLKALNVKKELQSKVTESVNDFLKKHKMRMNEWVYLKTQESILKLLSKARAKIKKSYEDKNMPLWIKSVLNDLVDDFWPDIESEILFLYQ